MDRIHEILAIQRKRQQEEQQRLERLSLILGRKRQKIESDHLNSVYVGTPLGPTHTNVEDTNLAVLSTPILPVLHSSPPSLETRHTLKHFNEREGLTSNTHFGSRNGALFQLFASSMAPTPTTSSSWRQELVASIQEKERERKKFLEESSGLAFILTQDTERALPHKALIHRQCSAPSEAQKPGRFGSQLCGTARTSWALSRASVTEPSHHLLVSALAKTILAQQKSDPNSQEVNGETKRDASNAPTTELYLRKVVATAIPCDPLKSLSQDCNLKRPPSSSGLSKRENASTSSDFRRCVPLSIDEDHNWYVSDKQHHLPTTESDT